MILPALALKRVGGGAHVRRKAAENKNFVVPIHIFFGSECTISRFGERFRDGQYSLVSFLFAVLLLTLPPRSDILKFGGGARAHRALWSRRYFPLFAF